MGTYNCAGCDKPITGGSVSIAKFECPDSTRPPIKLGTEYLHYRGDRGFDCMEAYRHRTGHSLVENKIVPFDEFKALMQKNDSFSLSQSQ